MDDRLDAADLEERLRAVRLAALHYQNLMGLIEAEDVPRPIEHLDFLLSLARARTGFGFIDPSERRSAIADRSRLDELARYRVPDLEAAHDIGRNYLIERLGRAWPEAREVAADHVGICGAVDTGLRTWLEHAGGPSVVDAAARSGLFMPDGRERFAGRLVYFWHDPRGRVAHLTSRAIPGLERTCPMQRNDRGEIVKGMALPSPSNNDGRIGLPLPTVPFGAWRASQGEGSIVLVEGELDAIHGLVAGPCVATGGTGRMGAPKRVSALREWLAGRPAIVAFDNDADPKKRADADRRAKALAASLNCRWMPADDIAEGESA